MSNSTPASASESTGDRAADLAALREAFLFESTQLLVGAQSPDDAIARVIELACRHLGWDWGAWWEADGDDANLLHCRHVWHPDTLPSGFVDASRHTRADGARGLLGRVLSQAEAEWTETLATDLDPARSATARDAGLRSGYAFPVEYRARDGSRRRAGVLEFLSREARQRDAQLPELSAAIAGLIAQTVERLAQDVRIRELAERDELTGWSNHNHFCRLVTAWCQQSMPEEAASAAVATTPSPSTPPDESATLIRLRIDRLSPLIEAFGPELGNTVIRALAERFTRHIPPELPVCHLGAGDFAVWVCQRPSGWWHDLADNLLIAARTPLPLGGDTFRLSASLGATHSPRQGRDVHDLLRQAGHALERSQAAGGNTLRQFDVNDAGWQTAEPAEVLHAMTLAQALREALVNQEFALEYQPLFATETGQIHRVEALLRWRRRTPTNGEVWCLPAEFLPAAEEAGLMPQISRWIMRRACLDLAWLRRHGYPRLRLHLNLSASEFLDPALPQVLATTARTAGLTPRMIHLEVTDRVLPHTFDDVADRLQRWQLPGFGIYLADFGAGHTPMAWLKRLPLQGVKLDPSLLAGIPHDAGDRALVQGLLDLGHRLGLTVIAQAIERDTQLAFLAQFGCPMIQGYLLAPPVSCEHLVARREQGGSLVLPFHNGATP